MNSQPTVLVDAIEPGSIDVFALGAAAGLVWKRHGRTIAGLGEYCRLPIDRPAGFASAQRRLAAIAGHEAVEKGGDAGRLVAFGALPFDRQAAGELIVPEVAVVDDHGEVSVIAVGCSIDDAHRAIALTSDAVTSVGVGAPSSSRSQQVESVIDPQIWRDEVVAVARNRIVDGAVAKVVVARELRVEADRPIDVHGVLDRLHETFPTACVFGVDGFIGASPELLVARFGDEVHAHPLAGTMPRSTVPADDERLAVSLLNSTKNRGEHQITIAWLLQKLLPFCSFVDAEPEPSVMSLANVHHLGTLVRGQLSRPPASILELVAALHPTPAVGGNPQAEALDQIAALEPGDRGRYAGPVGWLDARGNGEFAVAIRSGEIDGATARVWAGVGVVADSDPAAELAETDAKFQAMLGALSS